MNNTSGETQSLKGLPSLLSEVHLEQGNSQQEQAIALLNQTGLPSRRTEIWKYTDLKWFNHFQFVKSNTINLKMINEWLQDNVFSSPVLSDLPRLIIANGQVVDQFSTLLTYQTCKAEFDNSDKDSIAKPDRDVMTTLNYAMGQKTTHLTVLKGQRAGTILVVHLGYGQEDGLVSFHPRLKIELQAHSQLSMIELNTGWGEYFTNPVSEVVVGSNADFQYNKLINSSLESYACANLYVTLADHAKYEQFIVSKGAKFSRQEVYVDLEGEWSNASFHAVQKLHDRQHADITTVFSHLVPHCQSEQNIKNILSDQSHGVFQGKVFVHQKAQKTNAQQQNQALLLSDQAEINTKPELEIYADDVKCSHGATVGALDEDQLFFLMARGIPYDQAREILTNAFVAQAVDEVNDPIAKALLKKQLGVEVVEDIM